MYGSLSTTQSITLETAKQNLQDLKKNGSPFLSEKQHEFTQVDHPKSILLEKGAFQYSMWLKYQQNPSDKRIIDYMIYKTKKYALQTYIDIMECSSNNLKNSVFYKNSILNDFLLYLQNITGYRFFKAQINRYFFVFSFWEKLYTVLNTYNNENTDRFFTAKDMTSFSFLFGFINDFAHERVLIDGAPSIELLQSIDNQDRLDHNQVFFDMLATYQEEEDGPIDFDRLKKWYGNKEYFIFPIFSTRGIIGLSVLIHAISLGIVLVGCGTQEAPVHNNRWQALTDIMFHDLVHGRLPTRIVGNADQPTKGELLCKKIAQEHIVELTHTYKNALKNKNHEERRTALKHILSLFCLFHEHLLLSIYFDVKERGQHERPSIDKAVYSLLSFYPKVNYLFQATLFQGVDMIMLYKRAYPALNDALKNNNLIIHNGMLQNNNNTQLDSADGTKIWNIIKLLSICMISAHNEFIIKYNTKYCDTLPCERCIEIYE